MESLTAFRFLGQGPLFGFDLFNEIFSFSKIFPSIVVYLHLSKINFTENCFDHGIDFRGEGLFRICCQMNCNGYF